MSDTDYTREYGDKRQLISPGLGGIDELEDGYKN